MALAADRARGASPGDSDRPGAWHGPTPCRNSCGAQGDLHHGAGGIAIESRRPGTFSPMAAARARGAGSPHAVRSRKASRRPSRLSGRQGGDVLPGAAGLGLVPGRGCSRGPPAAPRRKEAPSFSNLSLRTGKWARIRLSPSMASGRRERYVGFSGRSLEGEIEMAIGGFAILGAQQASTAIFEIAAGAEAPSWRRAFSNRGLSMASPAAPAASKMRDGAVAGGGIRRVQGPDVGPGLRGFHPLAHGFAGFPRGGR